MTYADVAAECVFLTDVAVELSNNAGGIQPPNRTELVEPPDFQDVALNTAPLWGQRPAMALTSWSEHWPELLYSEDRHQWSVVACQALEWTGRAELWRNCYAEYLLAHAGESSPSHEAGIRLCHDVVDRLQWTSWATFTLVRREIRAYQQLLDVGLANGPRAGG
jgi:hypothetical protein